MRDCFTRLCFKALVYTIMIYSSFATAQEYNFCNFNVESGLPSSEIYRVYQDKNGLLWLITDKGVCYYDGYDFNTSLTEEKLFNKVVLDYFVRDDYIWFVTLSKELYKYHITEQTLEEYPYNDKIINATNASVVIDLYVTETNDVYMEFKNTVGYLKISGSGELENNIDVRKGEVELVNLIDESNSTFSYLDNVSEAKAIPDFKAEIVKFPSDYINLHKLITVNKQHKILHNGNEVYILSGEHLTKKIEVPGRIYNIGTFGSFYFWVSTADKGVHLYDLSGNLKSTFLEGESVTDLTFDHESGMWITTINGGVYYAKDIHIKSYTLGNKVAQKVTSLTKDQKGNLYIAYDNGSVYQKTPKGEFNLLYESETMVPSFVQYNDVYKDVLVHNEGVSFFLNNQNQGIYSGYISGFTDDIHDYPMVVSQRVYSKFISKESLEKSKPFGSRIYDAQESNSGCFIATMDGIYYRNNGIESLLNNDPLYRLRVNDIDQSNEVLYGASHGKGVLRFDQDKIKSIDKSDGLFNNIVQEVYVEDATTVWACTNSGLNRLIFKGEKLIQLDGISTVDGLISDEVIDVEILNDSVWVGTRKGLCVFPKKIIDQKKKFQSDTFFKIASVKVNDNEVTNLKGLNYNQNRLQVTYSGISFKNSDQLEYRYKLDGLEDNWHQTNNKEILYSSVPPGEYDLTIQIREKNKKWLIDQQILIPVQIHEAFWKTGWFICSVILLVALLIYLFFKIRVLSYNEDIIRELLRTLMKKVKTNEQSILVKVDGKETKIITSEIHYIKSSGNYIEIVTQEKSYLSRDNIKHFMDKLPDKLEFIRIHRSYVIRIDKVSQKNSKTVVVLNEEIPVGKTYRKEIEKIFLS